MLKAVILAVFLVGAANSQHITHRTLTSGPVSAIVSPWSNTLSGLPASPFNDRYGFMVSIRTETPEAVGFLVVLKVRNSFGTIARIEQIVSRVHNGWNGCVIAISNRPGTGAQLVGLAITELVASQTFELDLGQLDHPVISQ